MSDTERKIYAAHEKHAWTLALLVFAAFGLVVYWVDGWLSTKRSGWADVAYFILYMVSFFAVFGLGAVKNWFLWRLHKSENAELRAQPSVPALHFKDAKSALEYSCKYMDTSLKDGELTPCIVVATSSSKESGTFAVVDIPTAAGIKRSVAAFLSNEAPPAVAGKLCAAMIGPVIEPTDTPTFLIVAELEPTWSDGSWKVKRRF